ncbi:MAG: sulfatase-like hydrolase/transferase [Prolixibacteraceae bacterium]|nr:sulfatase-like hydrolase/transferase [Prolixibacteraceae bacterium]
MSYKDIYQTEFNLHYKYSAGNSGQTVILILYRLINDLIKSLLKIFPYLTGSKLRPSNIYFHKINIFRKSIIPCKIILPIILITAIEGCNQGKNQVDSYNSDRKRPNVLFIFADDQRADAMGCAGNTYIKTPNIDKLAEKGIRFTNCYVMGGHHGAVCAPSRAMLMSGKSLFHVYDKLDGIVTMPMHFAAHGYETFGTGKWHNGAASFEASFQKGENVFLGGMSDHFQTPYRRLSAGGKLTDQVKMGFSTDNFADAAKNFLQNYANGKREKPFFCYVSFTAPHDPRSPRKDYIGIYPDSELPLPGNFMELHPFVFDNLNIRDETLAPWPRTPEIIRASLADYYALITHLDDRVGDIIATLELHRLKDNTIIVYAADNGLAIGSHGLLGKQNLYEHSIKVPLIICGPGIPENQISDALVYLFDLFPTLAAQCGLPEPNDIDGHNLTPIFDGETSEVRNSLYTAYRNTVRAVRTKEWKLILYPQRNYDQLFNLTSDPLELVNLADNPDHQKTVKEMIQLLEVWHMNTDDTATLYYEIALPLEYDYKDLKQSPDIHQPDYVLKKYFKK